MTVGRRRQSVRCRVVGPALLLLGSLGCAATQERSRLLKENESLGRERERLERGIAERDAALGALRKQVEDLQGFGPDRPLTAFAPVKIEIASLSGGHDYDGKPGDDGVTVYLRPRDADGDTVKVPGRIRVQLLDNSDLASPALIGVYRFDDLAENRKLWHGKFATQHYTLRCPFPPGVVLPAGRKLLVSVAFIDVLSGVTLTATQEVEFARPDS